MSAPRILNPVIQREFLGILRNPRALAVVIALSLGFSMMVLMRWPSDGVVDLSGTQAQLVFQIFGYGLMAGMLLLVPAFPATSIVRERNKGTLALLLNSPLSAVSIYWGKFIGMFLFAVLLILTSLPAAAACYAMGGINLAGELGLLYLVLLIMAVQYVTLGLLVSTYTQTTDAAVRVTYAIVFALCFLALGPHYFFQGQGDTLGLVSQWLRQLSPIPVVMRVLGHSDFGVRGLLDQGSVNGFFAVSLVLSAGLAAATIGRLNYRLFDRARSKGRITDEQSLATKIVRRLVYVVDPQRRKPGIPFYLNPVMVKEFRSRRFGRSHWMLRLIGVCAIASLLLTFAATTSTEGWGVAEIGWLMVLLQVALVVLITPSLASGLISSERESGGWELLRMTPLSAGRILRGKLLSVLWTMLLILSATLPGYVVMIYIKPVMWLQVSIVLVCLLCTGVLTLMASAAIGSLFHRTASSTTSVYIFLMVLFLAPMIVWMGRDAPFGHTTVQNALLATPVGAALSVMDTRGFAQYELLPGTWWVAGITTLGLLVLLAVQVMRLTRPT